ncbi:MAG: dTMP kinase [Patescibacteria group bacterium]|nr:dTMP kinase [Patescibacteria group bacterium]
MFIVIEGIDGAGCETQAKILFQNLITRSVFSEDKITLLKYPDYERNTGKLIKEFLYENRQLTVEQQYLLFTIQFVLDAPLIREKRAQGVVIADRYFTTTLCYQTLSGINLDWALEYAKNLKVEVPDLIFFLEVDPQTAFRRKLGEKKQKNRQETDFKLMEKTFSQYQFLINNQIWTRWLVINGRQAIEKVAEEVYNKLLNNLREMKT